MLPAAAGKPSCAAADRLSALPDGVLHVILSFLPAPQMVQTTVLSRRWRDLWCSTPYINIDQPEFGIEIRGSVRPPEEKWAKFENFSTNLLLFHCSMPMEKFRLHAHSQHRRDVNRWIRQGIHYCLRVVKILMPGDDRISLLLSHLGSGFCRFKKLHLFHVTLDSHFAEVFCSSCSVLEKMKLTACSISFQNIMSSTLKKLFLDSCDHHTPHPVVISIPCIELLDLYIQSSCYQDGIS